jgi:conjugative transposon TraK protein
MFKKMKNIETAFQHIRTFSLVFLAANILIVCFTLYRFELRQGKGNDKVLILPSGKLISGELALRKTNIGAEARDHVRSFHQLFFTLDPDDKAIRENLTKALYLADGSARDEYENLQENGYYAGLVAGNISQRIKIDSVWVDPATEPYLFKCYATQLIIRSSSKTSRSLVTSGQLREVSASDNNPHGFLIEKWTTLVNTDLKTETR